MSKHKPPPGAKSIDQILSEARSHLQRITPSQLLQELQSPNNPVYIIDIRPAAQRATEGSFTFPQNPSVPLLAWNKIHVIERNILEWRLDSQSGSRIEEIIDDLGYETRIVVVCSEGYTSSLAARELGRLGLGRATDLVGGLKAWKEFVR